MSITGGATGGGGGTSAPLIEGAEQTGSGTITNYGQAYAINVSASATITLGGSPASGVSKVQFYDKGGNVNTYPVTITDGGSFSYTFDDNGGAVVLEYRNGAWYATGDLDTKFAYNASGDIVAQPSGSKIVAGTVESGTVTESFSATGDASTGDYEDPEASIEYSSGAWRNIISQGADLANGLDPANYTTVANTGSATSESVMDNDSGNITATSGSVQNNAEFQVDLGSSQAIDGIEVDSWDNGTWASSGEDCTLYGKVNSGDAWTQIRTFYVPMTVAASGHGEGPTSFTFSTVNYRYLRFTFGSFRNNSMTAMAINVFANEPASSNNSVQARIPFTGTKNFAPASLSITNESDASLSTGQVNVSYSFDDVSYSSLVDIATFQALSKTLFASKSAMWIKVQPVGTNSVKTISIDTEGSKVIANTDLEVEIDGVTKASFGASNIIFNSLPTSDPSVAGALWNNSGVLNISAG